MKPRWLMLVCLMMFCRLLACSLASSATPAPAGGEQPIGATASPEATLPPIVPGTESIPTRQPPTVTPTLQASVTPTSTVTLAAPTATRPPVSTGPLDFTISIVGCQARSGAGRRRDLDDALRRDGRQWRVHLLS